MLYKTKNLTQCVVSLKSRKDMVSFLNDRERSIRSKLRKHSDDKILQDEMHLIVELKKEIQSTNLD